MPRPGHYLWDQVLSLMRMGCKPRPANIVKASEPRICTDCTNFTDFFNL
ncbi:Uncharacterized protein dnm_063400 [Desulfonema magnum]|uniref:Uncharacterized protein n=1 Tax=Desulfonema magnum TaxID=45655 RepID=A0A975BS99_9BACT|nr:Uncharacterized protein dnm_063400 [Desulfonema magnum]